MKENTIDYYNENAKKYFNDTVDVEFAINQDRFLKYLRPGDLIMDFGCGSGRDIKCFLDKGYKVHAIDGSKEMCKVAREYSGINVDHLYFEEFKEKNKYDGVWACSSILHLPYEDLEKVVVNISESLKAKGVFYTSFKYSDFEGMRNGRHFTDMKEEKFEKFILEINVFDLEEMWITGDVRPGREDEKWLNTILRKKN